MISSSAIPATTTGNGAKEYSGQHLPESDEDQPVHPLVQRLLEKRSHDGNHDVRDHHRCCWHPLLHASCTPHSRHVSDCGFAFAHVTEN